MALVKAVFYTDAHRISGIISLRERLSEALNDPMTDYLELNDVKISKLSDPSHRAVQWPNTVVPKKEILLGTLDAEGHESTSSRIDKATQKSGTQVGCIVGTIEVYGTAHVNFVSTTREVLLKQLTSYFPVTEATVLFPAADDIRLSTGLALVNRTYVKAFSLL